MSVRCSECASHSHTFELLPSDLAQEHAAQFLAPVLVLGVFLLDEAVEVALALVVGRRVELFLGRPISERPALEVDDVLPIRLGGEDGEEGRHGLLRHGGRGWCARCAGVGTWFAKCRRVEVAALDRLDSSERFRKERLQVALGRVGRNRRIASAPGDAATLHFTSP